jgi:dynein heavy chain
MLVGPSGGGKTVTYRTLKLALTKMQLKVNTHVINPKAVDMGQLYGRYNEHTHEWNDGILAYLVRELVKEESAEK